MRLLSNLQSASLPNILLLSSLLARAFADDVLETTGFSNCINNATITIQQLVVKFDKQTNVLAFNVAGENTQVQNVSASLVVSAYGKEVYSRSFNPCEADTYVSEICPVPTGNFSATGSYTIPSEYSSLVPAIAYQVPNLDGQVKLLLTDLNDGAEVACMDATVSNGKSASVPAAKFAAVGVAGAAFVVSGISAVAGIGSMSSISSMTGAIGGGGMGHGMASSSPTFGDVVGHFQSMAMMGMLSVNYPSIYRSFTQNFGFSSGLISWNAMQVTIDNFRASTGGNLTDDNIARLHNSTIVFESDLSPVTRRSLDSLPILVARQIITSINGSSTTVSTGSNSSSELDSNSTDTTKAVNLVHGINGYVQELSIPRSNVFMTVLLFFAIVLAAIAAGILLFKVILEVWALFSTFPVRLTNFRKQYWWLLARTITNLILLLYGVWTLYCVYQFTTGDSWAAKVLAGVTLGLFTLILMGFTYKIWRKSRDVSLLYEDKETWRRYSLFYENYKRDYWWLFVPTILYMFSKGCLIAAADGHGLVQTAGQLIIESLMLVLLLWSRPFALKSGNWINIIIQFIRVASVACILIFVEELGFSQTTKTVTGLVLVIMQAVLTTVLALLILINAIITCFRENPHHRRRKEAEKLRLQDELTPLDARNSMLMYPMEKREYVPKHDVVKEMGGAGPIYHARGRSKNGYDMLSPPSAPPSLWSESSKDDFKEDRHLPRFAATIGGRVVPQRTYSEDDFGQDYMHRQAQLPDFEYRGRGV